jgi:hypothetical protein
MSPSEELSSPGEEPAGDTSTAPPTTPASRTQAELEEDETPSPPQV